MSDDVARRVGARMRALRLAQGLTQAEVSERAGFTVKYVNEIENGRRRDLPLSTLAAIVERGLGASLSAVFARETRRKAARVNPVLPSNIEALAHEIARLPASKRDAVLVVLRATLHAVG
jgi:transcriptional regulator with XRE-family HTH domain